jgi:hypothetical protein
LSWEQVILAGDFVAKQIMWRASQNNTAGQSHLKHYYKNNYVSSAPSQPKHFPDRNIIEVDILDVAILSNVLSNHTIRPLGSPSTSDHNPVLLTIRSLFTSGLYFIYGEVDWKLFQSYVIGNLNTQCLDGNCPKREIDVGMKHLTDTMNSAALYAIKMRSRTFRSMQIAT